MGRPSKFTPDARKAVLEVLQIGGSRPDAAAVAKVGITTLKRWIQQGKELPEGSSSPYRKFYDEILEAEAHPKMRALGIIYNRMEDRPDLAWKFIERRVDGYQPPVAQPAAAVAGPVNITLSFSETARPALSEVIDVSPAGSAEPQPSELPARAARKPTRGRKGS